MWDRIYAKLTIRTRSECYHSKASWYGRMERSFYCPCRRSCTAKGVFLVNSILKGESWPHNVSTNMTATFPKLNCSQSSANRVLYKLHTSGLTFMNLSAVHLLYSLVGSNKYHTHPARDICQIYTI